MCYFKLMEKEIQAIKCVVVGDEAIGKTCMLTSYTHNYYPGDGVASIFADIFSPTISIDQTQIRLSLWDSADQIDCDHLNHHAYRNTHVVLICFSIMDSKSFKNVKKWHKEVNKYCRSAKILLVGTKIDMRDDEVAVSKLKVTNNENPISYFEGIEMAREINALRYLECSALTRVGLANVFEFSVKSVLFPLQTEQQTNSGVKRLCEFQAGDSHSSPAKIEKSEDN